MKLTPAQQAVMDTFHHKHWLFSPERDGSWCPPDRMHVTMNALVKKGLLRTTSAGEDGFHYTGWALK